MADEEPQAEEAVVKDPTDLRGTGRTTRQMQEAPPKSIFIGLPDDIGKLVSMAHDLGRDDLMIKRPSFFEAGQWRGCSQPVVIDHAVPATMTADQAVGWRECEAYLRLHGIQVLA